MKRITINVPEAIAAKAQRAVDSGTAASLSGYFCALAEREPDWVLAREAIDELIQRSGGISAEARQWALESLGISDEESLDAADSNQAKVAVLV